MSRKKGKKKKKNRPPVMWAPKQLLPKIIIIINIAMLY